MQSLILANMTLDDAENDYHNSYMLEQLVSADFGWKIVYNINEKYFVEDILAYALIRNGVYCELIPLTPQELHLPQSLSEYVLKDGYVATITPDNELIVNKNMVEDVKHLDIRAIQEALGKSRVQLN